MAESILFIFKNACLHLVIHSKLVADERPIGYGTSIPLFIQFYNPQIEGLAYSVFIGECPFFRDLPHTSTAPGYFTHACLNRSNSASAAFRLGAPYTFFNWAVYALYSFDGMYLMEFRIKCTMQRCTTTSLKMLLAPSSNPDTPSMLMNSTSSTPLARISSNICIQ